MEEKTVLVVDVSETIRRQVAAALSRAGFNVVEAHDGVEGLERIDENALCMVILDVAMPRMGGLEMLDQLRENPDHKDLPVLMLTTEVQTAMIQRAKKACARGWIIKPVKSEQLVEAVLKLSR